MGKIYCSNCGAELDDSDKFCSSCGNVVNEDMSDNQNITKNNENLTFIERIEIIPLTIGILFYVIALIISSVLHYQPISIVCLLVACSGFFLIGYLSKESLIFVLFYAVFTVMIGWLVYWLFFSRGFFYLSDILMPLFLILVLSFIGNLIKIKLKS